MNTATTELDQSWEAKPTRKQSTYCRWHGRRIIIFLNDIGFCRRCVDNVVKTLQERRLK